MQEWIKILASSAAGFFAGVLLEPVKLYFGERHNIAKRRNAILREVVGNYCELKRFLDMVEAEPFVRLADVPNLEMTIYEHLKNDVLLFSQISPSAWIDRVYGGFYYVAALSFAPDSSIGRLSQTEAREYKWKSNAACKHVEAFDGPRRSLMKHVPKHLRVGFKR